MHGHFGVEGGQVRTSSVDAYTVVCWLAFDSEVLQLFDRANGKAGSRHLFMLWKSRRF